MTIQEKINTVLRKAKNKPLPLKAILAEAKIPKKLYDEAGEYLIRLVKKGSLSERNGKYRLTERTDLIRAQVEAVHATYGFAHEKDGDRRFFLPGKLMLGALPGDIVLLSPIESPKGDEARVVKIEQEADYRFAGTVVEENGKLCVLPDRLVRIALPFIRGVKLPLRIGDKILARAIRRGKSHFDLRAEPLRVYGEAQNADVCAQAILEENGIITKFSQEVLEEADSLAAAPIHPAEIKKRHDLRGEKIFTIDSADSKDLDDAVSVKKTLNGWILGVHIADVSFYVRNGSALDKCAFERGTSVYYADKVIPMLPRSLSNGICSLNPGEDRLTFSVFIRLDREGKIIDYKFEKTVIRSAVKGVYREINAILDKTADHEIKNKYRPLLHQIARMNELSRILIRRREARGCPELSSSESKFIIDENRRVTEILPRKQGVSERMIEEFMLLANQCAATLAAENGYPFVYRIHELPSPDKVAEFSETVHRLGFDNRKIDERTTPSRFAEILEETRGSRYEMLINNLMLRSMAKARYNEQNKGHFGLALKNYAHFTSPIRRYPDLAIHRILTAALDGASAKSLEKKYGVFVKNAAAQSSFTEENAVRTERDCEDCYKAQFMQDKIGQRFHGIICSVTNRGLYVELPNTVQGMISVEALPAGNYETDGNIALKNLSTSKHFTVGDEIEVEVIRCDISRGTVDFSPIFDEN